MKRLRLGFYFAALLFLVQPVAHALQKPQQKSQKKQEKQEQPITKITFSKKQNVLKLYGKDPSKPFKTIVIEKAYDVHTYDAVKKDSTWVIGIENAKKGVIMCTVDSLGKQTLCTYYPAADDYSLQHEPGSLNVPALLDLDKWKHKEK